MHVMAGCDCIDTALLRFLVNDTSKTGDVQRWAAEGMAYLSLDADVKELVIQDDDVLRAIHRVCMSGGEAGAGPGSRGRGRAGRGWAWQGSKGWALLGILPFTCVWVRCNGAVRPRKHACQPHQQL